MQRHRQSRFAWFGLALAVPVAASLGGCGTVSEKMAGAMGSMPGIGLPANTPERPTEKLDYPPVHDMPPQRTTAVLTGTEQQQLERDLVAAREGHRAAASPSKPAAKPAPVARKPAAPAPLPPVVPASSSRMIY